MKSGFSLMCLVFLFLFWAFFIPELVFLLVKF